MPNNNKKQTKIAEETHASILRRKKEKLYFLTKRLKHASPHLHSSVEVLYVIEGTMELGMKQELFHMEEGDVGVIFPDVIHHCQVFSTAPSIGDCLWVSPSLNGQLAEILQKFCPKNPVIKKEKVHSDIRNAFLSIKQNSVWNRNLIVEQAYAQIILARSLETLELSEKSQLESNNTDIIYKAVSYIVRHFKENISLDSMAIQLGISKFVLSRVFSGTFHRNFKQYVNEQRLNYVSTYLECTDKSITEIWLDAGFESQRTFNRVFRERYHMTPREYRNQYKKTILKK